MNFYRWINLDRKWNAKTYIEILYCSVNCPSAILDIINANRIRVTSETRLKTYRGWNSWCVEAKKYCPIYHNGLCVFCCFRTMQTLKNLITIAYGIVTQAALSRLSRFRDTMMRTKRDCFSCGTAQELKKHLFLSNEEVELQSYIFYIGDKKFL